MSWKCANIRGSFSPEGEHLIGAIVRYLVAPREAGSVKTSLIKKLLPALNAAPDKVLFPKGPNR